MKESKTHCSLSVCVTSCRIKVPKSNFEKYLEAKLLENRKNFLSEKYFDRTEFDSKTFSFKVHNFYHQ